MGNASSKRQKKGDEEEEDNAQININQVEDKHKKKLLDTLGETEDKLEKGKVNVDFEYAAPSEPYFHIVKALLNQYLDGEEQDKLDLSSMSDHLLERASIGSVIVSSLG